MFADLQSHSSCALLTTPQLARSMLTDTSEKPKNPLKKAMRRRHAKDVSFATELSTYFEASDMDWSSEDENADVPALSNGVHTNGSAAAQRSETSAAADKAHTVKLHSKGGGARRLSVDEKDLERRLSQDSGSTDGGRSHASEDDRKWPRNK